MQLKFPSFSGNRSSLVFVLGLLCAAFFAVGLDGAGRVFFLGQQSTLKGDISAAIKPVGPRGLVESDWAAAKVAWLYFQQNTRPETGLVDSVAGFPSGTLWDQGSYLLALSSAHALGIIDDGEFMARADQFLNAMMNLPLFEGKLPNKVYNTKSLEMTTYDNSVSETGIGWSALDLGRLLSAMRILERRQPELSQKIRSVLARWELEAMTFQGELTGAAVEETGVVYPQEGRVGYEQYAARAAALWGLDVIRAISAARIVDWEDVSGVEVPIDLREFSAFRTITPTLSEPYFLQGMELGFDSETEHLAAQIYLAQEARSKALGVSTMVSEDHVDQEPYFLYSSVHSNGSAWAVVSENGTFHNDKRTISLKAVFAWDALYGREYTARLREDLSHLATDQGWAAGQYEADNSVNTSLTLNTNAVVLEALHYKKFGPLWQIR